MSLCLTYFAAADCALALPAPSTAADKPAAIASVMRRSSLVNASCRDRYSASTATTPETPASGTASAERSVLYLVGSLRYPGSTDGLPFRIGLLFCATHPDKPSPSGIRKDENKRKLSPLTYSGVKMLSCLR